VPGVKVHFEVLPEGVNYGQSAIISTSNKGLATWTYTDKSLREGTDNIRIWIDRDSSGSYEAVNDASVVVKRVWLNNFVTGNGNIMDGNKLAWTFEGSFGMFNRDMVGEFKLVDHVRGVIYQSKSFNPNNNFMPSNSQWFPDGSLPASAKVAIFSGTFTNNLDANQIDLSFWVVDAGEPGSNIDRISVKTGTGNVPGAIWIGTPNPNWMPNPAVSAAPYSLAAPISNGEIKVYKTK
jgi:hypothetical protein